MAFLPIVAAGASLVGQIANAGKGGASAGGVPQAAQFVTQGQAYRGNDQTQTGIQNQLDFVNAVNGVHGLQNQSNVFNQQQGLANQLQGVANGTGPNPALAQLHQSTGQNVANQAALMAGQRGSSANAGLIARQAGQQGGAMQQQAAGQGATLQAQQQLAAMQTLQQQQAMLGGTAGAQVAQQQNALNGYQNAAQNQYSAMLGAGGQQNQAAIQNASMNNQYQMNQQKNMGNILGGLGNAAGAATQFFNGSNPTSQGTITAGEGGGGGGEMFAASGGMIASSNAGKYLLNPQNYANGGMVNAMVSPGERYLPPSEVKKVAKGHKSPMRAGEKIAGKAKVKGDSLKNDTVPKKLKEGGIVLPKSVTEHPNAPMEAKRFVQAILAKNRGLR